MRAKSLKAKVAAMAVVTTPIWVALAGPASATTQQTYYVAPAGSGTTCTATAPCSITQAQTKVEGLIAASGGLTGDVEVQLADGAYRLSSPLTFTSADGGNNGHTVTWDAAPGAHPILSGAQQVTGTWTQVNSTTNLWSVSVPAGTDTRQLYVNGRRAPIAQGPPPVGLTFTTQPGGEPYYFAADTSYTSWRNPSKIEFVYTGGQGAWAETHCRVAAIANTGSPAQSKITMSDPCWQGATTAQSDTNGYFGFRQSGYLVHTAPTTIANAYEELHVGQWYLDTATNTLYYQAPKGTTMTGTDVEIPTLQSLVNVTGTQASPVNNVTFNGLGFEGATWLDPSTGNGFDEVQANLRMTSASQGTCTFTNPVGSCPLGALSQTPSAVSATYAHNVNFTNSLFTHLGAGGLTFGVGAQGDSAKGNVFTDISSIGVQVGNIDDPNPSDHRDVVSYDAVADNLVTNVGVEFQGAPGIALWYGQHISINHNDIHNVPYDGITSGAVAGHANTPNTPDQTFNDNLANTISNNVIYNYMQVLQDGGAIYTEGSQGQTQYNLGTGAVDDGNANVTYTGSWINDANWASNYNGTQHDTSTNGDSVSYTFTGTAIDYITAEDTNRGQVQVYIDGTLYSTNDCYSSSLVYKQVCARVRDLSSGTHTIKVVKLGGSYMTVDAFNIPATGDINSNAGYTNGLKLDGNVVFAGGHANFNYYNDIGSQWLTYTNDIVWNSGSLAANGGCAYSGHISFTGGYTSASVGYDACGSFGTPPDTTFTPNTTIPNAPGATDISPTVLSNAGIEPGYAAVYSGMSPTVGYNNDASGTSTSTTPSIFIAGSGFASGQTTVSWKGIASTSVTVYSPSFLVATVPIGVNLADLSVNTTGTPQMTQVDDSDTSSSGITYTGSWSAGSDGNQIAGTQHYTTTNGASLTYSFTGTGFNFITADDSNRGNVTISVDGTTVGSADCYSPVLLYKHVCASVTGLTSGPHAVTISKVDGTYMSVDAIQAVQ